MAQESSNNQTYKKNHMVDVDPLLVAYARKTANQELKNYHIQRRKNAHDKILKQPFA